MYENKTEKHLTGKSAPGELEQQIIRLQKFLLPYINRTRSDMDTRLVHWVVYYDKNGFASILDSSSELLMLATTLLLDRNKDTASFSQEQQNVLIRFCNQVNFVVSYGLPLKMLHTEQPVPRFSKENYQTLYQLGLTVLPLYSLALQLKKMIQENSKDKLLDIRDFERMVSEALNQPLPADDELSKLLSALKRVNGTIENLCNEALDNFLTVLQYDSGQKKRKDGTVNRIVSNIQILAKDLRDMGSSAGARKLYNMCCKELGRDNAVSLEAKRLVECYESPATSYLKDRIHCDKQLNSPLENYLPLQLSGFLESAERKTEPQGMADTLMLELSRNPSPKVATYFLILSMEQGFVTETMVEIFLAYGADVNSAFNDTLTILQKACFSYPDLVPVLLNAGADPDVGWRFLMTNLKVLECLHRAGAKLDILDEHGNSLLHIACSGKAPDIADYLLQQGLSLSAKNKYGQTPAHLAYTTKFPDFENINQIGCVNSRNPVNFMKKHLGSYAERPMNLDMLRLLDNYQADLSSRDFFGLTPLDYGHVSDCEKIIEKFRKGISNYPHEVFDIVIQGKKEKVSVVKQYLAEGGDINITHGGVTLLFQSALCGYDELTKTLLDGGAHPDYQVKDKQFENDCTYQATPLFLACQRGGSSVSGSVRMLLEHGADLNRSCKYNMTPFLAACENRDARSVWLMVELAYDQLMKVTLEPIYVRNSQAGLNIFIPLLKIKPADESGNEVLKFLLNMLNVEKVQGTDKIRVERLANVIEHLRKQVSKLDDSVKKMFNESTELESDGFGFMG